MRTKLAIIPVVLFLLASCAAPPKDLRDVEWRAWLDSPGGELPFGLELRETGAGLEAFLLNGTERIPVSGVEREGAVLTLDIEQYDSRIEATFGADGHSLDGRWEKTGVGGAQNGLDFHAVRGDLPRFERSAEPDPGTLVAVGGRWTVDFEQSDAPAVGIFETKADGTVQGTFLTTTGDYRYLAGSLDADRLRLSCFDGAHAFLFDARLKDDGTLAGDFWSRDSWHERWTARKDPAAALPDAFELTRWVGGKTLDEIVFPDLDGRERSLADPEFAGRARIIVIFGSWCPNCGDATRFLVELHEKYHEHGLSILGLGFELTGDFDRDAEQLRVYAKHHGVRYPLLVGGTRDREEASRAFPLIDEVRSYPTTVFLHGDGRVRAVHQGYAGPATGEANRELRARFETLVQELVAHAETTP
jgi:thiol-disulfide isomerase/thioredoxin